MGKAADMATISRAGKSDPTQESTLTMGAAGSRAALHRLVDELPNTELPEAARLLDELLANNDSQDQALIERWIRPHPHRSGPGDAVVAESYVLVYALIGDLPTVCDDLDRVAADYEVPREAVEAALAYYRRHRGVIDARIYTGEPAAVGAR